MPFLPQNAKTSCPLGTQSPELEDRDREQNEAPIIQGEMLKTCYGHSDRHRSLGLDRSHPRIPRELVQVPTESLAIIYQQPWLTQLLPANWKSASMTASFYKKGYKVDLGNFRLVSRTSVPGKVMEQIILHEWHAQDKLVIGPSQRRFMKGRSCLTNLISS